MAQVVVVLVTLALPLVAAAPPASASQFRLPSRAAVRGGLHDVWSWVTGHHGPQQELPVQQVGTATGNPHEVASAVTRAGRGTGSAPGKGAGQLPAYQVLPPKVRAGLSARHVVGFNARTSRFVAAKSTAMSDLYQNTDGSFTRRIAAVPVNFRNAAGQWQPIDTTPVLQPDGRWVEKANSTGVSFAPSGASRDLITVRPVAGESVSLGVAGAAAARPVVTGKAIRYAGIRPGSDLVEVPTSVGYLQSLVLHSATAASSWVYPLDLHGLRPVLANDGSVYLVDAKGTAVEEIAAAYAYDSKVNPVSGERGTTDAVTYRLTTVNGSPALMVTLDRAWLRDAARVFPVTVNSQLLHPTATPAAAKLAVARSSRSQTTLAASINAVGAAVTTYAESQNPGDHSQEETIKIGSYDAGTHDANSFLSFPGVGVEGSKITVSAASLNLWDLWASICTAERFDVAQVTTAWTPSGITSYPGPSYGSSIGNLTPTVSNACKNTSGDMSVGDEVTVPLSASAIQGWANGTTANNGLAIYASTTDNLHWKQFGSDSNPYGPPVLTITYTAGVLLPAMISQYPADQTVENTLTPTLVATGTDDNSINKAVKFDFQVYNTAGTKIADSGAVTDANSSVGQGIASWTVPSGDLKWGTQYYWTVQAYDGTNYSPSPSFYSMSVQVPQPAITSELSQNDGNHGFDPTIGNYTTSVTDANVATVGPSLNVVRDYNSLDPRTAGAFGASWSSIFDARAVALSNSVNVTYPDGSVVGFGKNPDGSYSAPSGRFAMLRSVTGGFTLTDKNDTLYTFTQSLSSGTYGIASVADSSGRAVNFTWTTAAPYEITTMTSAVSGRALHLTWSTPSGATSPHVASVATDSVTSESAAGPLTWTYGYTGDQLTSVCPPTAPGATATACTTYSYTAGSDFHSATLDESPRSYWPLSEASGTTASDDMLQNEGSDNATYSNVTLGQAGPLAGATTTAAGFNGTTSLATLPNLHLDDTFTESVSLWFKTSTAGGTLLSAQDSPVVASTTNAGNVRPVLYVGTDGKLRGAFWTGGSLTMATSNAVVDDGNWHHVVLTGSTSAQTMYIDGAAQSTTAPGSTSSSVYTMQLYPYGLEYDYLGTGLNGQLYPDSRGYSTATGAPLKADYFNGSLADFSYWGRTLSIGDISALYSAGTTQASLLSQVTQPSGNVYGAVTYDPNTTRVQQVTDENGGVWKLAAPTSSGSSEVYRTSVLGAGPQDYWRLGDAAGTAQPANQVHGSTATYANVTLGQSGPFADDTAASFGGSSSYISLPSGDRDTTGPGTIGLWFKTTGSSEVLYSTQNAAVTAGATSPAFTPSLYVGQDGHLKAEFWVNDISKTMTSASALNDGKWHFAVLSGGTATQSLYVDGTLQGTAAGALVSTGQTYVAVGSGYLGGSWPDTASTTTAARWFNGSIAEVAWYRSALSADQVRAQYEASRNSAGLTPVVSVKVTDPGNKTLTYEYDPLNGNREIASIDALGNKTSYGYDTGGFLYTVADPDGNVTTTGHDPRGNAVSTTTCQNQAASQCSTVYKTYYPDDTSATLSTADPRNDQVLTIRDGRSSSSADTTYETSYTYNPAGDVTALTTPPVPGFSSGRTTNMTYSDGTSTYPAADSGNVPAGLPVKIASPGGATQTLAYNHDGDLVSTTNADGLVTEYTYDSLGRVQTKTEIPDTTKDQLVTSYTYDGENRVVSETDPGVGNRVTGAVHTAQTTTAYDDDGNVLSQVVADTTGGDASRTLANTYNSHDQLETQTDAAQNKISYTYDAYGNKATETDADGNVTSYTYDPNGKLLTTTLENYTGDPASPSPAANLTEETRCYDPAGRLARVIDSMGDFTTYTYTDNGLLATTTRSTAGSGITVTCTTAATSSYVVESDSYDAAGNAIKKVANNGATTTTYAVDPADRVTTTTQDPAGADRVMTTSYTPDDKPATVTNTSSAGATQVTSYTYDPMGDMTSESVAQAGAGGPVAWYPLTQTSGTSVTDSVSGGQTATASGVTWTGSSASLTGTSGQQIATGGPVVDTTGSFTVAAWVNMAGNTTSTQTVVAQAAGTASGFYLKYDSGLGEWTFTRPSTDTTNPSWPSGSHATTAASTGTWTFLTGTYNVNTGTVQLYVNGSSSGNTTGNDTMPFSSSGPLLIGRSKFNGHSADFFDGQIADVQVYPRALSANEVSALYGLGQGGSDITTGKLATSWTLDKRGLPTSMTSPDGNITGYSYDEAGRLAVTTEPSVSTEVNGGAPLIAHPQFMTGYDTFGETTETDNPDGKVTTTGYDGDGHVTSQTLPPYTPPGGQASITTPTVNFYDGNGNLTQTTDPLGNVTKYVYDQLGDLATKTAPDTGVTHYTYDTDGQQLTGTGPTGAQTQATYDFLGRQLTSTVLERYPSAATLTTNYAYTSSATDPGGAWLSGTTTPDGVATSYGYDNLGDKASVTNGAADKTSYGYDFLGRQISVTAPDSTRQATSYDVLGDPVQVQQLDALGTVLTTQSATYDGEGQMLSATDARGHASTFSYDATGLLSQEVQPVSATSSITTSFGYDAAGNRTRYTDGNGNNWITTYNSWNLAESQVEPATSAYTDSTVQTAYDADGRPVAQTLPGGVQVSNGYDQMGRLTSQSGSGADAPTATRSFTYDTAGNMLTAGTTAAGASAATSETFTYNDRGQVLTTSGAAGSSTLGYNGDGLLASRADAAGTTSYSYDNVDRLSGLTDPATGAALTYGYNNDSELTSVSYGASGDTRSYGYNSLHQLTGDTLATSSGTTLASISYGYDPNGNLTSKTTTGLAGAAANTYTYDWANRLASWDNGTTTANYGYDANGNRTQAGSATYTYDARDELTSDGTNTYNYTARGTLASTTSPTGTAAATADAYGQQLTDGTQSYAYDALGRLMTVTPSGGTARTLSYSGTSDQLASDGTSTYSWTPGGSLVGIGVAGGTASQGVLAMTDQHTDVVANFTPAGTALSGSTAYDPLGNVITASGASAGNLGYQSAFTDPVSKKSLMGARWYNPATGGFTSRDTQLNNPVPSSADANPFAYAGDDPMLGVDPTGHSWWSTATSWVSDAWDTATSWVSGAWDTATSWVSSAWDSTMNWLNEQWQATERWLNEQMAEINRQYQEALSSINDTWNWTKQQVRNGYHRVVHAARKVYNRAVSYVRTAYHEVKQVAKEGGSWVYNHRAAIVSMAAGAAVFIGCEALTDGIGSVGCAEAAGAVGNLVDYGMSCGSSSGHCSVGGALLSAGIGAVSGAVGGELATSLGGELASSFIGDALPSLVTDGIVGAASGAGAGAVGGAMSYGAQCLQAGNCSASGLGHAMASGSVSGAEVGGAFGAAGGGLNDLAGGPVSGGALDDLAGASCGGKSFTAGTLVLLASGVAVPISQLKKGEKVKAINTKTGKADVKTIEAVLVHYDTDLYDLTVKSGGHTEVIHTTASHLFWDPYLHYGWIRADHLKPGMHLKTPDGPSAVVVGGSVPAVHDGWMWDLTVQDDHDFYVEPSVALPPSRAGPTSVLVHNENCGPMVLGIGQHSDALASKLPGGYTFNGDEYAQVVGQVNGKPIAQWQVEVNNVLRSNGKVAISLGGMDGATPAEQFMNAYNAGSGDNWRATEWEMYQVGRQVQRGNLDWGNITFYNGGGEVVNVPKPAGW